VVEVVRNFQKFLLNLLMANLPLAINPQTPFWVNN
jgi:hypothetical protein